MRFVIDKSNTKMSQDQKLCWQLEIVEVMMKWTMKKIRKLRLTVAIPTIIKKRDLTVQVLVLLLPDVLK